MSTKTDRDVAVEPTPEALELDGVDLRGTVFVIPLDAPLPNELADVSLPTGTLYKRLAALDATKDDEFAFVPLSGSELLSLERSWRALQTAKKIAVLRDLPGARYDILFTQAARQIGLRPLDWPLVADLIARRVRTLQRTKDTKPWNLAQKPLSGPVGTNLGDADRLPSPPPSYEGSDEDQP